MLAFLCRDAHLPAIRNSDATRKQSHDEKSQERSAYRPYPEAGAELAISPRRVIVFKPSAILKQRPQWRCVSSCDGRKTIEQPNEQMEHA